jgi:hypothetical protein
MHEIATSDFLLLLDINNLDNAGYAVPAKLFDYTRMGRPILATASRNSPVERILMRSGLHYGCLYPEDSEPEIARKLIAFLSLPSDPQPPSAWFLETFDGARQGAIVASLFDTQFRRK